MTINHTNADQSNLANEATDSGNNSDRIVPMKKHPMQNIIIDKKGIARFQENAMVVYLLNKGGIDMNNLAMLDFSDEDRMQFAQLIGYSVCG